ncbi:MAG: M3 family metallopeptidase [Sphingomicrobium sp.]
MLRHFLAATAVLAIAPPLSAHPVKHRAAAGRASSALLASNPFAKPSALPFQAPDFAAIRNGDYLPAMLAGMAQQKAEVLVIANQKAPPTFDNTLAAMERSGTLLERTQLAFSAVQGANTNDALDAVDTKTSPLLAAHRDFIFLNAKLFARVKSLHDRQASLGLNPEQSRLLTVYYDQFVHSGALLSPAKQVQLKQLNLRIGTLQTAFGQKLLAATKEGALHVADKAALAGLSDDAIAAAAEAAKARKLSGYLIPLQNTTQQPQLSSLTDRATREALFTASAMRASHGGANDTRPLISEIAELRAKQAALLGYPNFSAYTLYDQMAKTPEAANGFIDRLAPAVSAKQRAEAADIQALIDAQAKAAGRPSFKAEPWDWNFYGEQIRKARYALDDEALKPYLEINKVLTDGVFFAANQLYGLTFSERKDLPTWNPDMRVFEVREESGKHLGLMYFDYWKRDNKSGGAWMSNLVNQSYLRGTTPVIYNVANFQKPTPGKPALISFDDVTTMFHEFGHALHGLFAAQTYPTISGTNTARDFVEFPSQFNENWALYPTVLRHYAVDYRTGAPIPQELVDKLVASQKFGQGFAVGETITAAKLDLDWHHLPAGAPRQDADAFEAKALAAGGFDTADVPPRYRSPYFRHIWSNGYASAYYAYAWTEMLDHDAFAWFQSHGGLTRANGQRFREMVLSRGNTIDYATMYRNWAGHDPEIGPMLTFRALTPAASSGAQ